MTSIGVDFGTTNSVVAKWSPTEVEVLDIDQAPGEWHNHGFSKLMPSVFAKGSDGQALFGWAAKRAERGAFEAVKRLFATQQEMVTDDAGSALAVEEVATMLFAELKRSAMDLGVAATKAVVTVPANSRGLARHRTKICAGMAGLEVMALLNEPTAAAMSYAADHPGDQQILVFDWGGGTLDVTVLRSIGGVFLEQASKGLPTKGGMDFDSRLARAILETVPAGENWDDVQRRDFALQTELAKIELSSREETHVRLPGGETRRVTRSMFERAVAPLIQEAKAPMAQCLEDLGVGAGSIDAVVMVGGTSKVPAVRNLVAEFLQQEPIDTINAMTAVGEGAAIAAAILDGDLETNDFFVSTEHALGTITHEPHDPTPRFSVLIPRNHKLPASNTERFSPVFDEQTAVDVRVIEGDPDRPVDDQHNVVLSSFAVELPEPELAPDRSFTITYQYDTNGILHIEVRNPYTDEILETHEVAFGITDDKRKLVELSRRAQSTVETKEVAPTAHTADTADPEVARLLQRAYVKVIPFLDDGEAAEVRRVADRLQNASPDETPTAKQELQAALAPYPYLF